MKKEVEVVGTLYTDAEKILRNIAKDNGEPWNANGYNFHELKLTLTPEPENEHDPNAIAVYSNYPTPEKARIKRSGRVGYLPRGTGIVLNEPVEVSATVKEGFKRFYISIDISDFLPPEKEKREIQLTTNDMNFLKKYFEDTKPVEKKEKIKMEKIFTIKKPGKTIITITGETITISRKGTLNMMNHGLKGDKTIPISNIIAIQVKKPGLTNGYLQFTIAGGNENHGGIFSATQDENTVMFSRKYWEDIKKLKEYIETRQSEIRRESNTITASAPKSSAQEIMEFKNLLDQGIITEAEFEFKKRELLNIK